MVAKVKVQNVRTGAITELARNSGYDVTEARLDKKNVQYLYDSGLTYVFMDPKTYDQIEIPHDRLAEEAKYLVPNLEVIMATFEEEIMGVTLPAKVAMTVTDCEPGVRGDTISNGGSKDAVLETGITIRVPLFINAGDAILVDTTTGKYDGRA